MRFDVMMIAAPFMRIMAAASALAVSIGAAGADDALESSVRSCGSIGDSTQRLACFDGIAKSLAPAPPLTDLGRWNISKKKSPLDDVDDYTAFVAANNAGTTGDESALLYIQCRVGGTMAGVITGGFLGSESYSKPVILRYGSAAAKIETDWHLRENGKVVTPPDDRIMPFIRSLPDAGTLLVQLSDFQGTDHTGIFRLDGIANVRASLAASCKW